MPDRAMRTRFLLPAAALVVAATAALAAVPDNWPRWRGSLDNGSAESGTYPVKWDANSGLLWKAPLPGKGCSTPVVWGIDQLERDVPAVVAGIADEMVLHSESLAG